MIDSKKSKESERVRLRKWAMDNPERRKEIKHKSYLKNKDKVAKANALYLTANKERMAEKSKEWRIANKDKIAKKRKEWRMENKGALASHEGKRRASKMLRTPSWLSKSDNEEIKLKYFMAGFPNEITLGLIGYEVDHYYPLQGKTVSGLHVPNNLNVMRASDNRSKHNRHPEV